MSARENKAGILTHDNRHRLYRKTYIRSGDLRKNKGYQISVGNNIQRHKWKKILETYMHRWDIKVIYRDLKQEGLNYIFMRKLFESLIEWNKKMRKEECVDPQLQRIRKSLPRREWNENERHLLETI